MAKSALVFAAYTLTLGSAWALSGLSSSAHGPTFHDFSESIMGAALLVGCMFVYRSVKPLKVSRLTKLGIVAGVASLAGASGYMYALRFLDSATSNMRFGLGDPATYTEYPISGAFFFSIVLAVLYVAVPFQTWFRALSAKVVEKKNKSRLPDNAP